MFSGNIPHTPFGIYLYQIYWIFIVYPELRFDQASCSPAHTHTPAGSLLSGTVMCRTPCLVPMLQPPGEALALDSSQAARPRRAGSLPGRGAELPRSAPQPAHLWSTFLLSSGSWTLRSPPVCLLAWVWPRAVGPVTPHTPRQGWLTEGAEGRAELESRQHTSLSIPWSPCSHGFSHQQAPGCPHGKRRRKMSPTAVDIKPPPGLGEICLDTEDGMKCHFS